MALAFVSLFAVVFLCPTIHAAMTTEKLCAKTCKRQCDYMKARSIEVFHHLNTTCQSGVKVTVEKMEAVPLADVWNWPGVIEGGLMSVCHRQSFTPGRNATLFDMVRNCFKEVQDSQADQKEQQRNLGRNLCEDFSKNIEEIKSCAIAQGLERIQDFIPPMGQEEAWQGTCCKEAKAWLQTQSDIFHQAIYAWNNPPTT